MLKAVRSQRQDELTQKIMDAPKPPSEVGLEKTGTGVVAQLMVGSTASLVHCRGLLRKPLVQEETDSQSLLTDLESAADGFSVVWDKTENLRTWAIGYFLNKAQQNIAASLDVIVSATLMKKLGLEAGSGSSKQLRRRVEDHQLLYALIGSRLTILSCTSFSIGSGAKRLVQKLEDCFYKKWADTEEAKFEIESIARSRKEKRLKDLYRALKPAQPKYCALVFARVNAFKHRPSEKHPLERKGKVHLVEWVITALAHEWTGMFWKAVVSDLLRLEKKTSPQ